MQNVPVKYFLVSLWPDIFTSLFQSQSIWHLCLMSGGSHPISPLVTLTSTNYILFCKKYISLSFRLPFVPSVYIMLKQLVYSMVYLHPCLVFLWEQWLPPSNLQIFSPPPTLPYTVLINLSYSFFSFCPPSFQMQPSSLLRQIIRTAPLKKCVIDPTFFCS